MAQSENNDPVIYNSKEEIWSYLSFLYKKLETEENWDHSTLDKAEIIHSSKNAVQCSVEFNRRDKNKKSYAKAVGIFTSTKWQMGITVKNNDTSFRQRNFGWNKH